MSIQTTNETLTLTLPEIPYLTTYPLTISLPTSTLRTLLRLVIIIGTYILFRPHIERMFKKMMGMDAHAAPESVEGMKREMRKFEDKTGRPLGGGKKVGVVTSSGQGVSGGGAAVRRKA